MARHRNQSCVRNGTAERLTITNIVDAVQLALELPGLGVCDEALVLVRDDGVVTRIVVDPLNPEAAAMWRPRGPGFAEVGNERVLNVVIVPEVRDEPLPPEDVAAFENLRDAFAGTGHPLLDVIRTDGDAVQVMSFAVGAPSPWVDGDPPSAA